MTDVLARFEQLDTLLTDHAWLWRPAPYREARPAWCARLPALTESLLTLSDEQWSALNADDQAMFELLAAAVPGTEPLARLVELPVAGATPLRNLGPHVVWDVPGRKWHQIESFVQALGHVAGPVLEWCGGKGHLGRLVAAQWGVPVTTIELNPALTDAGEALARRARVEQTFQVADALSAPAAKHLSGRHALALHACGELHRTLIRQAVDQHVPALDIAPCCYHLGAGERYRPFTPGARLQLTRDDLRLAVTETATAAPREVRMRDQEMAWKLGFDALRSDLDGAQAYRSIRPIEKAWLRLDFAGFCLALASREGMALPDETEWARYEALGWQRQREVMRLSLVRKAFRRALELWLVLDLANYLRRHGYRVSLSVFCPPGVTPRNLLLSARHREFSFPGEIP